MNLFNNVLTQEANGEYTKSTILVVDDEAEHIKTLSNTLPTTEYQLIRAPNGEVGCLLARERLPDLIIMDWQMPNMNGLDVIKLLRKETTTKAIPVIIATGIMMEPEHLALALEVGAVDYIQKPIESIELLARVHSALRLSSAMKEIKAQNKKIVQQKNELTELDHFKSRFFTNISHELRTPLTLISSPVQHLLKTEYAQLTPNVLEQLKLIQQNSKQLKDLVDDILELSKLESNKIQLHEDEVTLHHFILRATSNFDSLASHLGIDYIIEVEILTEVRLLLDASKVEKILNNLISNAIKHTPLGGVVQVKVVKEKEQLVLIVHDTGVGISEADISHVFDRFFQSKQSNTPLQSGTGIGLALAKELTELMEGTLQVESELGKGSTFSVRLPYREAATPLTELLKEEELEGVSLTHLTIAPPAQEEKRFKVLIVEDHPNMQQFINNLLSHRYHTYLANNGKQALDILEKEQVDLIVSDVMMPEMDGYELLQALKDSDNYHAIPVIMLTALDNQEYKLQALTIGVDDYLTKPFSYEELLARIYNLLIRYKVRQEFKEHMLDDGKMVQAASFEADTKVGNNITIRLLDKEWLDDISDTLQKQLENTQFRLSDLADQFHLSERQFQRRVKKLTGLSPKKYQQEIALQKARKLLEKGVFRNVKSISSSVGMRNVSRFSKQYEARFGKKPKDYFTFDGVITRLGSYEL